MKTIAFSILISAAFIPQLTVAAELVLAPGQEASISANSQTDVKCLSGERRNICRIISGKSQLLRQTRDVQITESGLKDNGLTMKNFGEQDVIILTLNDVEVQTFGKNSLGWEALQKEIQRLEQEDICSFQP